MAYTIYMLPEGQMTISGGVLDGVTQGDGSHLLGASITLNSNDWMAIDVTDNDPDFDDNDGNQRLGTSVTVDGVTYSAGSRVEAEYSLTVSDGTNSYTLVAFNFATTSPAYATIEGLAFIGPTGGFPPIGVPLNVTASQEFPSFAAPEYASPICFAAGTRIAVPGGEAAVETLAPGDLVLTRAGGPLPVLWIASTTVPAQGAFAPVEFAPGAVGNTRTLRLSRQHRLRYSGWRAELLFGEEAVLIPAAHFVDGRNVRVIEGGFVTYFHLMLDRHSIVFADGAEAESFLPTAENLARIGPAARASLLSIRPDLARGAAGSLAHPAVGRREARALLAS
ncbi:Hint domain-containing protein [Roseibacterium sp. SDUM158016]|uniref:Hint domain-containing protein n=1 Tax=Roseicyclus sediminis TaxID=2980997 RepID=UPI0021D22835|nr:Hint domain-containing protein [Roseibacterium sp. SDUM158016]MCU4652628.1 Hint domain-containing protein [Roseibacterium sp. SDUM158016]